MGKRIRSLASIFTHRTSWPPTVASVWAAKRIKAFSNPDRHEREDVRLQAGASRLPAAPVKHSLGEGLQRWDLVVDLWAVVQVVVVVAGGWEGELHAVAAHAVVAGK
jgi:hypothetical protein